MKKEQIFKSILVIFGVLASYNLNEILQFFQFPFEILPDNDYLRLTLGKFLRTLPILVVVAFLFPKDLWQVSGLGKSPIKGFAVAIVSCAHLFIVFPLVFGITDDLGGAGLFNMVVLSGFQEELVYRALFFGVLYGLLGWNFWPAVLANAAIFGFGHLYQASDFISSVLTLAITVIGAVWFAWLYIRWNYNLWVSIFIHMLMNFSWAVSDVASGTAGGGIVTYVARAATIAISIWITLKYTEKMKPLAKEVKEEPQLSSV